MLLTIALALMAVPGANLLNYFFSEAISLPLGLTVGLVVVGIVANHPTLSVKELCVPLLSTTLCLLLLPLLVVSFAAIFVPNCDYPAGLLFFAMGPVMGALYMAAVGLLLAVMLPRKWATLCVILWLLSTAAWNLWLFYTTPQVFAYNPVLGFYSGTIYDEVIELTPTYLAYRVNTLIQIALFILIAGIGRSPSRKTLLSQAAAVLLGAQVVGHSFFSGALGFEVSEADIQERLGGRYESAHFIIYYPDKEISAARIERLAEDHEFRYFQLKKLMGVAPQNKIRSYLYANQAQKRTLMGADKTYIAKPWQGAVHLHDLNYGAPVLKHELAHVFGAEINRGFLAIPTSNLGLPKMGIVEGLAVAATNASGRLTLHQWSAAMVDLGLAPKLSYIFDSHNFLGLNASMAYTLSGSFLLFLLDRYGLSNLQTLYASGEFESTYGEPLSQLEKAWEDFVTDRKKVLLTERDLREARFRFDVPSVFHRVCALEVARWERQAATANARGQHDDALALYQKVADSNPKDLGKGWQLLQTQIQLKHIEEATAMAQTLAESIDAGAVLRTRATVVWADLLWYQGKKEAAKARLKNLGNAPLAESLLRGIAVRELALTWPREAIANAVRDYLLFGDVDEKKATSWLQGLSEQWPAQPILHYLLARRLTMNGERPAAIKALKQALAAQLQPAILVRESHRLLGVLLLHHGRLADARQHFGQAKTMFAGLGFKALMQDWIDRALWLENTPHG